MNLNDVFPNIYVINMSLNLERRFHILDELSNLNFNFLEAEIPNIKHHRKRQKVGNRRSHLKAIVSAKANNWPYVLVLEDDIVIDHNLLSSPLLRNIQKFVISADWACFYLGGRHRRAPEDISCSNVRKITRMIGTHAIAYHSNYYDSLIKLYNQRNQRRVPIDYFLSGHKKAKESFLSTNPCFSSAPLFIYQQAGYNVKKKYIPISFWFDRYYKSTDSF